MQRMLWIDVETTGLMPRRHGLLEVAGIITDENGKQYGSAFQGILLRKDHEKPLEWNSFARTMHEKNGLVEELKLAPLRPEVSNSGAFPLLYGRYDNLYDLEEQLMCWYESTMMSLYDGGMIPRRGLPLAGSNPGFDRAWLEEWLPSFAERMHYRSFDMNTLYYFFESVKDNSDPRPHRAVDDLLADIAKLAEFRDTVASDKEKADRYDSLCE